ncbi:MAG: hypothetical protein AB8G11_10535 [Saprospiraceae bacterium]
MNNIIKNIIFGVLCVGMIYISSCTKDPQPPYQPDCDNLYPEYDGVVDTNIFIFQWCAVEGATQYRIIVEGIDPNYHVPFDTIVEGINLKSTFFVPTTNDPSVYVEVSPFEWGNTYEWRVAPIIDGQQGEWSDIYTFRTWDVRDEIIGTYTLNKYIYKYSLSGYSYPSTYLGEGQVKVEKIENSKNIRITEVGGNNLTEELDGGWLSYSWSRTYDTYPNYLRTFPNDSIEIVFMTNPGDSIPWGYYFGGHY